MPGMAAHILHQVSLAVDAARSVALMGRNGAGKSTTLKSIAALVPPARAAFASWGGDREKSPAPDRAARPGLCARGSPHLHRADGAGRTSRSAGKALADGPTAPPCRTGRPKSFCAVPQPWVRCRAPLEGA